MYLLHVVWRIRAYYADRWSASGGQIVRIVWTDCPHIRVMRTVCPHSRDRGTVCPHTTRSMPIMRTICPPIAVHGAVMRTTCPLIRLMRTRRPHCWWTLCPHSGDGDGGFQVRPREVKLTFPAVLHPLLDDHAGLFQRPDHPPHLAAADLQQPGEMVVAGVAPPIRRLERRDLRQHHRLLAGEPWTLQERHRDLQLPEPRAKRPPTISPCGYETTGIPRLTHPKHAPFRSVASRSREALDQKTVDKTTNSRYDQNVIP